MTLIGHILVALLAFSFPAAFLFLGARAVRLRSLQSRLLSGGKGVSTSGVCVNLKWTGEGLVSSGIRYTDAAGHSRVAWTSPRRTIPVHVGKSARVLYDVEHKADPVVDDDNPKAGSYVAGGFFCAVGLAALVGLVTLMVQGPMFD
ncbi:hypothetical protein ACFVG1_16760 [Streptomyces bacillaris]|uniref:DUF3592 domain-containing protein n=1 Tax=Streptomyces bacillaris TaxID=68179 RepID=A0ABW6DZB0_9ACTN|nr:hypothetical protein [Streptomyces nanshensis]